MEKEKDIVIYCLQREYNRCYTSEVLYHCLKSKTTLQRYTLYAYYIILGLIFFSYAMHQIFIILGEKNYIFFTFQCAES